MYIEKLKEAFCIDESFSYDNMVKFDRYDSAAKPESYSFTNMIELFSKLENLDFKSESLTESIRSMLSEKDYIGDNYSVKQKSKSTINEIVIENKVDEKEISDNDITDNSQKDFAIEKRSIRFQIAYIKYRILQLSNDNLLKGADNDVYRISYLAHRMLYIEEKAFDTSLRDILEILNFSISNDRFYNRFKTAFSSYVRNIIKKKQINTESLITIQLYLQLYFFYISKELTISNGKSRGQLKKESYAYLAYLIGACLYRIEDNMDVDSLDGESYSKIDLLKEGFYFSKKGLGVTRPEDIMYAFNNLGIIAIDLGYLQLANDVYVSWIQQKRVGEMTRILPNSFALNESDLEWRESANGKKKCAAIYANLAYVCGEISSTYELDSKQGRDFYNQALNNIKKAVEYNPESASSYCSYGTLLASLFSDLKDKYIESYDNYKKYYELSMKQGYLEDKLSACRHCCVALMNIIFDEILNAEEQPWQIQSVNDYYLLLKNITNHYYKIKDYSNEANRNKEVKEEINGRDGLFSILQFCGDRKSSDLVERIHILLIAIRQDAYMMRELLRRKEYLSTNYYTRVNKKEQNREEPQKIAYYTTLKNVTHLFEDLYIEKPGTALEVDRKRNRTDTKNCLTVMNAKYMNDPNEGVVIINELTRKIKNNKLFSGKSAYGFTQSVFEDHLVFLKSFTEQIDKLTMWTRYANDYSDEGQNGNGCCVLVDPECFVNNTNSSFSEKTLSNDDNSDDYNLYRVVYVSSEGNINLNRNPGLNENFNKLFDKLKDLFFQLNNCLCELDDNNTSNQERVVEIVKETLRKSLEKIIFLFKYEDYSDENESRLVFFRNSRHQNDIKLIESEIPMLALQPFFQIMVKGIIFGPNVRNPEKWRPYFQYQLNRMWNKAENYNGKTLKNKQMRYTIEDSEIRYFT